MRYPKSSVELIAVMWGSGCSLCLPMCCRSWGWVGAKLQSGRGGYGGFTFLTGQMFAFFTLKHLLTCSILESCEHCFKGKTEVTVGYQPYAMRGHRGISGCCWFKTNGGNVWRCFLPQGCLNFPGKVVYCRTAYRTLCHPGGTNLFFGWWPGFVFRNGCLITGESFNIKVCSFVGCFLVVVFFFFLSSTTLMWHPNSSLPSINVGKCPCFFL